MRLRLHLALGSDFYSMLLRNRLVTHWPSARVKFHSRQLSHATEELSGGILLVSRASLTSKESESGRLRHTFVPPTRILAEPMKTDHVTDIM